MHVSVIRDTRANRKVEENRRILPKTEDSRGTGDGVSGYRRGRRSRARYESPTGDPRETRVLFLFFSIQTAKRFNRENSRSIELGPDLDDLKSGSPLGRIDSSG